MRALTEIMADAARGRVPVSVKCRLGTLEAPPAPGTPPPEPEYEELAAFVHAAWGGPGSAVSEVVVHARTAVLSGLSPAANRERPPLRPQLVERLAADFPRLRVVLNGGLRSADDILAVRRAVREPPASGAAPQKPLFAGAMAGRLILRAPLALPALARALAGSAAADCTDAKADRALCLAAIGAYGEYAAREVARVGREAAPATGQPLAIVGASLEEMWREAEERGAGDEAAEAVHVRDVLAAAAAPFLSLAAPQADFELERSDGANPFRGLNRALLLACGKQRLGKIRQNRAEGAG